MAIVQFKAFVDEVLVGRDGPWGLKTSEPHQRKVDGGGYETTGRTFRTVRGEVDLSRFGKGDRIAVAGTERTEVREHEGQKFYNLVVWADAVSVIPQKGQGSRQGSSPATEAPGTSPSDPWGAGGAQAGAQGDWAAAPIPDERPF